MTTTLQQNAFRLYAEKFGRPLDNNFAVVCADQNTTEELMDSLEALPDPADVSAWGLVEGEWHAAITAALHSRDIPA